MGPFNNCVDKMRVSGLKKIKMFFAISRDRKRYVYRDHKFFTKQGAETSIETKYHLAYYFSLGGVKILLRDVARSEYQGGLHCNVRDKNWGR